MSPTMVKTAHSESLHDEGSTRVYGFLIYILQDLVLFATLFANFAVFASSYGTAVAPKEVIDLSYVLIETFVLLVSSITFGFAMIAMRRDNVSLTRIWLVITFILGAVFIGMEIHEFCKLVHEGVPFLHKGLTSLADAKENIIPYVNGVDNGQGGGIAAYWSAFFALVGTHGLHVTAGLIALICMFAHIGRDGLTGRNKARLGSLSLFWHFLDIVWVGVFTSVYLLGAL